MTARTANTLFGNAWLLLQPTLQIIGFWFLLDVVLKIKFPNGEVFINYFLIGILPWLLFSEVLSRSLTVLSEFSGLYRRSPFPISILPLLPLLLSSILYALIMTVTVTLLEHSLASPLAVLFILLLGCWLIPFCYLLSVIGLFLKDLSQFFPFFITLTLYLSPILYTPDQMPAHFQWLLAINPIADLVMLAHALIQGTDWTWPHLLRPIVLWVLMLGPAFVLFKRAEPHVREML